jgi:hypothetical protein
MKTRLLLSFLLLSAAAFGRQKVQGYCEQGGNTVTTNGYASTTKVQKSFPGCTVTVYLAGTTNLATIYADNSSTPKANPFTASASDGLYFFYADNARYDVRLSGGGITTPFTIGDVLLSDPAGFTATVSTFNGRTGNVSPATDDYNFNQLAGTVNIGTQIGAGDKQGTDSKLLMAGAVSGEGNPLCVSGNGGATTSGCTSVLPTPTAQLQQLRVKPNTGNNTTLEFALPISLNSVDFHFTAQSPGGSLIIGNNLITLSPVPVGVNWNDAYHYLYISGGTGTAEACLIVAAGPGSATSGAASGTLTISCANTHSGAWTIQSATAGIQEAVNSLAADGGTVTVPVGNWFTYATITVANRPNIQIVGASTGARINPQFLSGDVFRFYGSGQAVPGWWNSVRDLAIAPPNSNVTTPNTLVAIHVSGNWFFTSEGNNISSVKYGVALDTNGITAAGIAWIRNNQIISPAPTTGAGVLVNGAQDVFIDSNAILGDPATPSYAGILVIQALAGVKINNNDVYGQGSGLLIIPGPGQSVVGVESTSNWYDSNATNGVNIYPAGGTVAMVRFNQDWMQTNFGHGVLVGGTGPIDDVSFSQCSMENNAHAGIYLANTALTYTKLIGLSVGGNGTSGLDTIGLYVDAGVQYFQITGGRYGATVYRPAVQTYGIYVAGGAADSFQIIGADVRDNSIAGILNGATGTHNVIRDNIGYNPIGQAAIAVGASPFTYTAGPSPETIYIRAGTVSDIKVGSTTVAVASPAQLSLGPNQAITVTYTVAPTMVKDVQ